MNSPGVYDVGAAYVHAHPGYGYFMEMDIFGTPLYIWAILLGLITSLLAFDLGVINKGEKEISLKRSLLLSAGYIAIGLAFALFVWQQKGTTDAINYVTGFLIEKSLAVDNIFVIASVFTYFAIPPKLQHRVLFWGILGVIVLRAIMIILGAELVEKYHWILLLFAAFLVFTGVKMIFTNHEAGENKLLKFVERHLPYTQNFDGAKFFTKAIGKDGKFSTIATPLFAALVVIEFMDLIFAFDSIPAIFAITTDPFIVFSSNIFAILGLRALFFALSFLLEKFAYLKYALGVLLIFIGGKIFAADLLNLDKIPALFSLGITALILTSGVAFSILKSKDIEQVK